MSTIRRVGALLAAGVWASAVAVGQPQPPGAKAVAEAFGPDIQELNIGAAAFQHLNNNSGFEIDSYTDGYLTLYGRELPGRLRGAVATAERSDHHHDLLVFLRHGSRRDCEPFP